MEYILQKFEEACDRRSIDHDINLRLWVLEAKDQVDLSQFKASKWWIWKFKKIYGIVFSQDNNIQDAIYASRYW